MNLHNTTSAISVRGLWKVFGDNPEKIVNSPDANFSRSELRAKTGNTAAVKDVSFDVAPGEVFVHRNIANMVIHSDMNMLSVLDYAVNALKVKHVIVCGHYGCGGVKAAMGNSSIGVIDNWIRHIKDVYRFHQSELDAIENEDNRFNRFVELNVKEQVYDLAKTSIVQSAWKSGQELTIHGWVYGLNSGYVTDLGVNFKNNDELDEVYQLKF